ncbi:hypothetical protein GCM10023187_33940 [Nibrella viscosa]|uniref:DUF2382 domain-containing protein n=1 Tax=Nibrella viscosa TaxID=1084524 RepID=A0ABP8KMA3_9BACT
MAQTVVGIFDNAHDAQQAVEKLVDKGFNRGDIDMTSQSEGYQTDGSYSQQGYSGNTAGGSMTDPGGNYTDSSVNSGPTGYTTGSGTTPDYNRSSSGTWSDDTRTDRDYRDRDKDFGDSIGDFFRSLFGGRDDSDAYRNYAEVGRRGSIVAVHVTTTHEAEQAAEILDDCGAIDVDERASQYRSGTMGAMGGSGIAGESDKTTHLQADAGMGTDTTMTDQDYNRTDNDRAIPIIEEDVQVGKREVETGGARIRSRIVERPVEEHLRLRTEHVQVERNPVNRPASDADLNAFKEGEIEVTERAEIPIVNKEARVVEEVKVSKTVEERDETVRETARKTEVDVDKMQSDKNRMTGDTYRDDTNRRDNF